MTNRPKIGNTILLYFYGTILLVLAVIFISFNVAARNQLEKSLETQLETARQEVEDFRDIDQTSQGLRRRAAFNQMMQENFNASDVKILFLDSNRELSLSILNMMPGMGQSSTGGMGMGMHGSTDSSAQGYFMRVDPASYREIMGVYEYVRASALNLQDSTVVSAVIGGKGYFLKSIPFDTANGEPEYVLAFIATHMYSQLIQNAVKVLSLVLLPILILTFFIVRYLAKRLVTPIARLKGLSGRLGAGDFHGEDLNLREQELVDFNQSLNETAGQLKEYHDNQKTFFQNVSHELRTPLTSIRGYAEGIRYGVFDKDNAAEVIMNESLKLEKLVDDILYLSRIESRESLVQEKTSLHLSELLYEAREQVANDAAINGKTIAIQVAEDPVILIHQEELVRALVNLLSNAIRYARSTIRLEGGTEAPAAGGGVSGVVITVADDGPGLEPGTETTIFKRFSKGPKGNHGIGLSITQAAVERHGGTVEAASPPGQGARFTIRLPLGALPEGRTNSI